MTTTPLFYYVTFSSTDLFGCCIDDGIIVVVDDDDFAHYFLIRTQLKKGFELLPAAFRNTVLLFLFLRLLSKICSSFFPPRDENSFSLRRARFEPGSSRRKKASSERESKSEKREREEAKIRPSRLKIDVSGRFFKNI